MKRLAKVFGFAALMLFVISCTENIVPESGISGNDKTVVTISASTEQSASSTKTSLNDDVKIVWTAGDGIALLAPGVNYEFRTSESLLKDGGLRADFTHEGSIAKQSYYAVYPYSSSASFNGTTITAELPTEQTAVAGSFAEGANLAVAYSDAGNSFKFKNAAAMVKISFKAAAGAHIRKITFRSLDENVLLSGSVALTPTLQDGAVSNVSLAVTSGVPYVSLVGPSGADLSPETDYYIAVAPAALTSGYAIEFEDEDGLTFSKTYTDASNKATLQRNVISPTGKKNFDNYEIEGWWRVHNAELQSANHPGVGNYLVVKKISDSDYRILDENGSDTYVVKGSANGFELSGSRMVLSSDYKQKTMESIVAFVFRNAWISSSSSSSISKANDEMILSSDALGIDVGSYKSSSKTYYYANIILYNRHDNQQITVTLDNLACSLTSDEGFITGNFNTKATSTNPNGNPNTCDDLVEALMLNAGDFSGYRSTVVNAAKSAIKGDDNKFTAGGWSTKVYSRATITSGSYTTIIGANLNYSNHFMMKTSSLLKGASTSAITLYKKGTKTYAYYLSNK
ncbi:MAG: hypothetical protein IKX60_04240 [Bacteroidales bacterium]|nr:hypothetical protein [Bacteroidales bacterium]